MFVKDMSRDRREIYRPYNTLFHWHLAHIEPIKKFPTFMASEASQSIVAAGLCLLLSRYGGSVASGEY
jgi:hypothetical protein